MSVKAPKFVSSPYFEVTDNGWHLRDGAPKEVVDEFNEYMAKYYEEQEKGGVL